MQAVVPATEMDMPHAHDISWGWVESSLGTVAEATVAAASAAEASGKGSASPEGSALDREFARSAGTREHHRSYTGRRHHRLRTAVAAPGRCLVAAPSVPIDKSSSGYQGIVFNANPGKGKDGNNKPPRKAPYQVRVTNITTNKRCAHGRFATAEEAVLSRAKLLKACDSLCTPALEADEVRSTTSIQRGAESALSVSFVLFVHKK